MRAFGARQLVYQAFHAESLKVAPDFVKLLSEITQGSTGAADVLKFLGQLWQSELPSCYLVFGGHRVLLVKKSRGTFFLTRWRQDDHLFSRFALQYSQMQAIPCGQRRALLNRLPKSGRLSGEYYNTTLCRSGATV